jgi:hypothetical protein
MSFIKVLTDVNDVISSIPARVVNTNPDGSFNIQYLSKTDKKHVNGRNIYEYETEIYNITDDSINEYMYDENEGGFKMIGEDMYVRFSGGDGDGEDDDDYVPSSECESEENSEEEDSEEASEEFEDDIEDDD